MTVDQTYIELKSAYSEVNLNRITAMIIGLYKSGMYEVIQNIAEIVKSHVPIRTDKINKCYTGLIMIYHPDKGEQYRREIECLYNAGRFREMHTYTHIFKIDSVYQPGDTSGTYFDVDYHPQYEWDYENLRWGYHYDTESNNSEYEDIPSDIELDCSFFGALKRKIYGSMNIDLPAYYLEDIEDIDMPDHDIENLDGIQYCIYATYVDLSCNRITDVTELGELHIAEELYLAHNQIEYIDAFFHMSKLRILDLSNNFVSDISPLFYLTDLEYVNLKGNRIPIAQIDKLRKKEVIVLF